MAHIRVIGGDIEPGYWAYTEARRGCAMHRTTQADWFRPEFVDYRRAVASIEEVSRMELEALMREAPWAFARGPITRTIRRLVESVLGERARDIAFRARMVDGRQFTAVTSPRIWHRLCRAVERA